MISLVTFFLLVMNLDNRKPVNVQEPDGKKIKKLLTTEITEDTEIRDHLISYNESYHRLNDDFLI